MLCETGQYRMNYTSGISLKIVIIIEISSGDQMFTMVTIANNNVLPYFKIAKKVDLKYLPGMCVAMDVLISLIL
jgi:hypothetical protein